MNDDYIVAVFVIVDDMLKVMNCQTDVRAHVSDAEVITVAIMAAKYFFNNHERALCIMQRLGYVGKLSVSRFNRRFHKLKTIFLWLLDRIGECFQHGRVFIIDTCPLPVCRYWRANRCRKVRGKSYFGYCASQNMHYFGFQLHLVCDTRGIPVAFEVLPARWDELCPLQYLLADLPEQSDVVADKGYISDYDWRLAYYYGGVTIHTEYRKNMRGEVNWLVRQHRKTVETVFSQLEKMGIQRLHARTLDGFYLKVMASLSALAFTNLID